MADQLRRLQNKRAGFKSYLTRMESYISNLQKKGERLLRDPAMLDRKNRLSKSYEDYLEVNCEISFLDPTDKEDVEDFEKRYFEAVGFFNTHISSVTMEHGEEVIAKQHPSRLPKIEVPKFSGSLGEYRNFISLFNSVIEKNVTLSQCDKLYYLKTLLAGEALNVIKHLPLISDNYAVAMTLLSERYDNKVQVINHHVFSLLDIPPMQKSSSSAIRTVVSLTRQHLGALKNMEVPTEHWDLMVVPILQRKLDPYTIRAYHLESTPKELPTLTEFLKFLENRASALEALEGGSVVKRSSLGTTNTNLINNKQTSNTNKQRLPCKYCLDSGHILYQCPKFKLVSCHERKNFVVENKLCTICLNQHESRKCAYNFKCSICKSKHNTLLHEDFPQRHNVGQVSLYTNLTNNVLLPTVRVRLVDKNGKSMFVRALLDSGSQVSFVLADLASQMSCTLQQSNSIIAGVCEGFYKSTQQAVVGIHSTINNFSLSVACHIINNITCDMPQFVVPKETLVIPPYVKLADNSFDKCGKVGMLLGCDVFFQVLLREQIPVIPGELYLQNTHFGYVVAGKVPTDRVTSHLVSKSICCAQTSHNLNTNSNLNNLERTISQFWSNETVPEIYTEASSEQELAEDIFKNTVTLKQNKFQVALPLKLPVECLELGDFLCCALKRFRNLEVRLAKDSSLYQRYKTFIEEYVKHGHAKYIDISEYNNGKQPVFLAHHPVFNEESLTTKLRVVFDGSMPSLSKISLNDVLLNGPVVQNDLFSILLLFRLFKYVINCDIQKMFRNINITPEHCHLQNILWRPEPNSDIKVLQLQTVTYGLKSSSFIATRCLKELVSRFKDKYPLAADVLSYNTYVDDINICSNDASEIIYARNQVIEILQLGGFSLHKWCTNDNKLLHDISPQLQCVREVKFSEKQDNYNVKTLGIRCDLVNDTLEIAFPRQEILVNYTKRNVLTFVSKIFDPLGLIGPVVVLAKLLMQQTWLCKVDWDSYLPPQLNKEFINFVKGLGTVKDIVTHRNINTDEASSISIVGFCDGSIRAIGACLYLKVTKHDGTIVSNLLCSKSRVNSMKSLSTPRVELNSALLLAKLACKVYNTISVKFNVDVILFSDSQVVLAWLNMIPAKLNAYVANRIKCIQDTTRNFSWHYVHTSENPADCLSRGLDPCLIQDKKLWWYGPPFVKDVNCVYLGSGHLPTEVPEVRTCHVANEQHDRLLVLDKFSSITKLTRIVAYLYRFISNCKSAEEGRRYQNLSPGELSHALKVIIRCEQCQHLSSERKSIEATLSIKSNLKSLAPFLDSMGLMRVGGRLQHSSVPYAMKHPIILPKGSRIVHCIIENEHKALLHAGPKLVLTNLCQKYYIVNGIREVKHVLYKCVICFRLKAKNSQQLMGSLPSGRLLPGRAFERVGIDYGGPFKVKMYRVRKPIIYKAYIVLFVCFLTKAIHIELVSDLTTECFLNALKRFISRRNKPLLIFCDNASTFKGAHSQLVELYKLQASTDHRNAVIDFSAEEGITFKFIPSYSPVFGGLWEAGIKSAKHHLKRVVGETVLTYEELNTVIIQIEGILNSRPLTALPTTDSNELPYLTPAHFLTGAPLTSYPEGDYTNVPIKRLKFWQQCTQMVQMFWKQWHKQYLVQLQSRPKWQNVKPNIEIGAVVIARDDNVTPLKWPMARVVQVFPGVDGKVRALSIKTSKGSIIKTSIHKVCVLPIEDN